MKDEHKVLAVRLSGGLGRPPLPGRAGVQPKPRLGHPRIRRHPQPGPPGNAHLPTLTPAWTPSTGVAGLSPPGPRSLRTPNQGHRLCSNCRAVRTGTGGPGGCRGRGALHGWGRDRKCPPASACARWALGTSPAADRPSAPRSRARQCGQALPGLPEAPRGQSSGRGLH